MEPVTDDVDEYLRSVARTEEMTALDALISTELPGLSRVLWRGAMWGDTEQTIIGYGRMRQPRPRGADVDWFLIGLAEQSKHLSVYLNAAEEGGYLLKHRADRLGKVKVGAAALTFTKLENLDQTEFRSMIARAGELHPDVE
ncbi:DUF1801 domain-containing protein [Nesterenkonia lutea]|uniref:YdhG-like domain-containing protein n=1 Tax=Nesterenkonia lutea TaxID=272919 RepID=A0ABR9JF34_9MICC|nr:DUF1801 domain-containing protein [Nesterenkonia lutea]MBE1524542.1 hypothetical protein [Nesterenkonia lutea]